MNGRKLFAQHLPAALPFMTFALIFVPNLAVIFQFQVSHH
jgi:hypothetical protein